MKKVSFIFVAVFFLLSFSGNTSLFGEDERSEFGDVVIAIDKSLSMDDKIEAVKNLVIDLITNDLVADDYLLVLQFYEKAEVAAAGIIHADRVNEDKDSLIKGVEGIKADGKWTDIGNVLDRLWQESYERRNNDRKKYFLLISDGLNEPPPKSTYYRRDRKLVHTLVDKLYTERDFAKWKVQVLALNGNILPLQELADILHAKVRRIDLKDDSSEFEILGDMEIDKKTVKDLVVSSDGSGTLRISVISSRYSEPQPVVINSIEFAGIKKIENILPEKYETKIPATGATELAIPVNIGKGLAPGITNGALTFHFGSEKGFIDEALDIKLKVNTLIDDLPWLIPAIIIAAILFIILIIFIIRKIIESSALRFRLVVEEMPLPKGRDVFKLAGKNLFIMESMDLVRIAEKLSARCIGKLYSRGSNLKIAVLKEKAFPEIKKIPENLLGHTIIVGTESGRKYHLKFEEV